MTLVLDFETQLPILSQSLKQNALGDDAEVQMTCRQRVQRSTPRARVSPYLVYACAVITCSC